MKVRVGVGGDALPCRVRVCDSLALPGHRCVIQWQRRYRQSREVEREIGQECSQEAMSGERRTPWLQGGSAGVTEFEGER